MTNTISNVGRVREYTRTINYPGQNESTHRRAGQFFPHTIRNLCTANNIVNWHSSVGMFNAIIPCSIVRVRQLFEYVQGAARQGTLERPTCAAISKFARKFAPVQQGVIGLEHAARQTDSNLFARLKNGGENLIGTFALITTDCQEPLFVAVAKVGSDVRTGNRRQVNHSIWTYGRCWWWWKRC